MHSREKQSSSTYQNTDTSFPNQETLTSHLYNPTHSEETPQYRELHKLPEHGKAIPNTVINKMKRQRNTPQVKEQDKCPPNKKKDKEIGNLSDKEFRIMIQNLEIKMESQKNSLRRCKKGLTRT